MEIIRKSPEALKITTDDPRVLKLTEEFELKGMKVMARKLSYQSINFNIKSLQEEIEKIKNQIIVWENDLDDDRSLIKYLKKVRKIKKELKKHG